MITQIKKQPEPYKKGTVLFVSNPLDASDAKALLNDTDFINLKFKYDKKIVTIHSGINTFYVCKLSKKDTLETLRKKGNELANLAGENKETELNIDGTKLTPSQLIAVVEGLAYSSYRFLKYFKERDQQKKQSLLKKIGLYHPSNLSKQISDANHLIKAVFWARTMVNEPVNVLNSVAFPDAIKKLAIETDFKIEVFEKKKIEALKMGGLLAVNKGSIDPPTFTICEWKPENHINKKPFVIVGKGIMYDTGGLSLKPTKNSMDEMKCDMAGAAAVAGTIYAIALQKLPVWVIALIPATDNRPDGNAYAPGDIIKMYNGLCVEVLNTDAEGRMILADALTYADQYNPELVMDFATLTGSAANAIGKYASVCMGNASDKYFQALDKAGNEVHERLVRFPFWDEYSEMLKSSVADLKNIGGSEAGAITAGKFLEHFTKSPYIHVDIAGTAFLGTDDNYRLKGGTGVGVRLLVEFFKNVSKPTQKD